MKRYVFFAILLLTIGVASAVDAAIQVPGAFVYDGRVHVARDRDAEVAVGFVGANPNLQPLGFQRGLGVGDFLLGGTTFTDVTPNGLLKRDFDGVNYNHLNGVFVVKVGTVTATGNIGTGNLTGIFIEDFTFVAPTVAEWAAVTAVYGIPAASPLNKATAGGMLTLFDNPLTAWEQFSGVPASGAVGTSLARVDTGGSLMLELGFTGAADANGNITPNGLGEGWESFNTPLTPVAAAQTIPAATTLSGTSFNFGVTRLAGLPSTLFLPVTSGVTGGGVAEFTGGGSLEGTGALDPIGTTNSPWDVHSAVSVQFSPIPEPSGILVWATLFGVCGVTMSWVRRRR